jgi:hypothetical protein
VRPHKSRSIARACDNQSITNSIGDCAQSRVRAAMAAAVRAVWQQRRDRPHFALRSEQAKLGDGPFCTDRLDMLACGGTFQRSVYPPSLNAKHACAAPTLRQRVASHAVRHVACCPPRCMLFATLHVVRHVACCPPRFDLFNQLYNPMGNPALRTIFLKTSNFMQASPCSQNATQFRASQSTLLEYMIQRGTHGYSSPRGGSSRSSRGA